MDVSSIHMYCNKKPVRQKDFKQRLSGSVSLIGHVTHWNSQAHRCLSDFLPWTGRWDKNSQDCFRGRILDEALCTANQKRNGEILDRGNILDLTEWEVNGTTSTRITLMLFGSKLYEPSIAKGIDLFITFSVNQSFWTWHIWNTNKNTKVINIRNVSLTFITKTSSQSHP